MNTCLNLHQGKWTSFINMEKNMIVEKHMKQGKLKYMVNFTLTVFSYRFEIVYKLSSIDRVILLDYYTLHLSQTDSFQYLVRYR